MPDPWRIPVNPRRLAAGIAVLAVLAAPLGAVTADAAPAARAYKNCKALNKVYPHGVGKTTAKDKTSGKRVTNFTKSNKVYAMNDGRVKSKGQYDLDRDNDGIACEKR